ncbi:MAG: malate synthase A, partial [Gemmatimonadetes bacterium]|nr:malate synthase A [Gemmatimonadota bacterium]
MTQSALEAVKVLPPATADARQILTPEALEFLVELHREFERARRARLARRAERQLELDAGALPG